MQVERVLRSPLPVHQRCCLAKRESLEIPESILEEFSNPTPSKAVFGISRGICQHFPQSWRDQDLEEYSGDKKGCWRQVS